MADSAYKIEFERQWMEKFPTTLSGLFSFYQCLCTIAIIGCEIGSILIDLFNATIYIGLWTSLIFMPAWILQAVSATCRHNYKFATITLIIQCIVAVFAACIIGFDAYFLINNSACFFSSTLCNSQAPTRGVFYTVDNFNNVKIPLIKGQLAIAVLMFAFSIDYIIMYVVVRRHIKKTIVQTLLKSALARTKTRRSTLVAPLNTSENIKKSPSAYTFPSAKSRNTLTGIEIFSESSMVKSLNRSRWSHDSMNLNPVEGS